MATKAFSYLRVSGLGQVDKDGFDRQAEAIVKYATAEKIEIVREFREEGVSGTKDTLDRPALTALIEAVLANGVKLILVEKADRLARDSFISELILRDLAKHGVRVLDASGTDLSAADDPQKKMIRQLLSIMAEYDKSSLVMKLRAARVRMKARGERVEGRKPFGDRPGEAEVIARISELRAAKKSFATIAKVLNDEKRPTRTGKPWHGETVRGIVGRG